MLTTTAIFLNVFGIVYVLFGVAFLVNRKFMISMADDIPKNKALAMLFALIPVTLGAFMVTIHNVWGGAFREVLVTVFGWLYLLGGTYRLLFTKSWLKMVAKCKKQFTESWIGLLIVVLGLVLIYLS